jgi:Tfp pilus assembly protein PilE
VKCEPCGQDNASSALFCTACRRPLVAPSKVPTRLEPVMQPAMAMASAASAPDSSYGRGPAAAPARNRFAPPEAGSASRMVGDADVMTDEEAWAAIVGDTNSGYYLTRFERLASGDSSGWHWPAFFVTLYWMLYRKMWLPALSYFLVSSVSVRVVKGFDKTAPAMAMVLNLALFVALMAVPAMRANGWYYQRCEKKIRDVRAYGGTKDQMLGRLRAAGGTSYVVLIFIAVVVIGIVAAVALPAYQAYTVKAKVADAMLAGGDVAAAVGKQYEQTGQLPGQTDVDNFVLQAAHHSKYVNGVDLDSTSGTLTVHVSAPPFEGSYKLVPSADNNRHLSWACMSSDNLSRYVPASCRSGGATAR